MLFNSAHYLIFLPVVVVVYYLLPQRGRWAWLLAASCYFYAAWVPAYLLVLVGIILVDYVAGRLIEGSSGRRRRAWLGMSLVANIGVLAVFKYFSFVNDNIRLLWASLGWSYHLSSSLGLLLPIGLSFHTFQAMSYTIEVYRSSRRAERHLGIYALYVMFFPQLVAGPIERPSRLLPQLREPHSFLYGNAAQGLALIAWGLFKKSVIADRLAIYVNAVYDAPRGFAGPPLVAATILFAFQIYCDFSGYSDIAVGSAQLMGIRLTVNFRRPYFSRSVPEFWRRWHISLSSWFRDYVYVPLGGNRVRRELGVRNIVVTFLLSGLWHGANWTYVVWGGLNGIYVIGSSITRDVRSRITTVTRLDRVPWLHATLQAAVAFALITVGWVFFRARTLSDATYALTHMIGASPVAPAELGGARALLMSALLIAGMLVFQLIERGRSFPEFLATRRRSVRWAIMFAVCLLTILLGQFERSQEFIYYQF